MFVVNEDLSIYATRGDIVCLNVSATDNRTGKPYEFQPGDIVQMKIYVKKNAEDVVLQKDFPVPAKTNTVGVFLTEQDTKFGDVISKPKDYWYEVTLNPYTNPQTFIGYDEDGAKIFKLFPEGNEVDEDEPTKPEDIPVVDADLSLLSSRPVENKAIARAMTLLKNDLTMVDERLTGKIREVTKSDKELTERFNNLITMKNKTYSRSLAYLDFITEETKAKIDGRIQSDGVFATITVNWREANQVYGGTTLDVFIIPDVCRPMEAGLIHTEDGLEYRVNYDATNKRYYLSFTAQSDVAVAPSGAGTVTISYALDNYEVKDIRLGSDGTTYESAGAAVRKQFTNLQQGTGLIEVREFNIEQSAAVNFRNVLPNATYNFDVANSVNVSLVVVYLYDKDGNYVHSGSHQPGTPFSVTTGADSDYIKLWMKATDVASGKVYQYMETGHSLDERMRFEERHHKAYNHIAGSTTGKIEFDTSAKTVTVSGLFFFEHLTWKNIASQTLDLTTYEANPSGETVKIVLDKNGNVRVKSSVHPLDPQDVFICLIMITGTWWFSANQIYTNDETKRLIYVDGKQMLEDINKVKSDLVSMFSKATPTNRLTCNIFKRVCVCGDSYTSGHIHDANGVATSTNEEFAWPHYMSLLTGNEWINCGQSGANVLTWQKSGRGLSKARSAGKVQAYVIGLMINDQSVGTDRYCELGTKADIGTDAQTYYGGMSKIIRELNAISPKAKIFVQTCPRSNDSYAPYNQAVHDIVEAYKNTYPVHCLDLLANIDMYSNQSLTQDAWYGHYTAIGYEQFAEILSVIMSDYINEHISAFRDVAFIEYDSQ